MQHVYQSTAEECLPLINWKDIVLLGENEKSHTESRAQEHFSNLAGRLYCTGHIHLILQQPIITSFVQKHFDVKRIIYRKLFRIKIYEVLLKRSKKCAW